MFISLTSAITFLKQPIKEHHQRQREREREREHIHTPTQILDHTSKHLAVSTREGSTVYTCLLLLQRAGSV